MTISDLETHEQVTYVSQPGEPFAIATSRIEAWIEQTATGQLNYYVLDVPGPASSDLTGFFDRRGFAPAE